MGRREVNSSFKWLLPVLATHRGRGEWIRAVCLTHTLCCTLYAVQLLVTSKGYRIQYTFKHKNITFTNLLLQLGKDWKVGAQWKYIIKCIYLKLMLRHGTLKSWLKCPHFIFCSKWPWPTNLVFYIIPSFLSNCTKWPYLKQSIHQGRKKQGHCVQGDYKHYGNQTHFPKRSILFRNILYKG